MWSRNANRYGWDCLLGEGRYKQDVSIYAAPSRGKDVTGLPPTFIDVGECEIFRDECVAYASKLWTAGVSTELHVWPGAFHGFDMVVPNTSISVIARCTRNAWVNRWFQNLQKVAPTNSNAIKRQCLSLAVCCGPHVNPLLYLIQFLESRALHVYGLML